MTSKANDNIKNQTQTDEVVKELVPEIKADDSGEIIRQINEEQELEGRKKYIKEDSLSGYLFDEDEITEYKRKQQIDIMKNQLLGDYDDEGKYFVSPQIEKELRQIKKEVVEQYKTYLFLHSVFPIKGFGNISFYVSVLKLSDGNLKARLVLLEKVDKVNGFITNTIGVQIDEYIAPSSVTFYEDMKAKFNIVEVDQRDINDDENLLKYCRLRKLQQAELWKASKKQIGKLQKSVFEKKIKALEEIADKNPVARKVLDSFYEESAKIDKFFLTDNDEKYIALDALLDECFLKNMDALSEFTQEVTEIFIQAVEGIAELQDKVIEALTPDAMNSADATINPPTHNVSKNRSFSNERNEEQTKAPKVDAESVLPGSNLGEAPDKSKDQDATMAPFTHLVEPTKDKDVQKKKKPIVYNEVESTKKDSNNMDIEFGM